MKTSKIVSTLALLLAATPAFAAAEAERFETRETVVHATTTVLDVELNEKTVICSRADYSFPMLKVLIPGLEGITLLNHQNRGAGAPCVTTNESCRPASRFGPGASPESILQGRPGTEKVEVTVTAKRKDIMDHVEKTCTQTLIETVDTTIRGKKLTHVRYNNLNPRNYELCLNGGK